jgi:hypothetical protein
MRPSVFSPILCFVSLLLFVGGCGAQAGGIAVSADGVAEATLADVRRQLFDLAADSMEGRATATAGEERAARYIAGRLGELGILPAGDSGFVQRVPLRATTTPSGARRLALLTSMAELEELPPEERVVARNVIGIVPGVDPLVRDEALIVGAHYDHVGIGPALDGDSIYNGADDDASGVVAVLEVARAFATGPPPARTVVFFLATGEETDFLGTRWYLANPVVPIDMTVAGLFIEMIGRPDALAGGHGRGWLTGFDRSTMGEMLAREGIPLVPDPRPEQNFFERSDNTPFAQLGVPAHVISSYNLHGDYHTPADEADAADSEHMTEVIRATVRAARALADGPAPSWRPGGQPRGR